MSEKICVLGSNSFIATHFIEKALELGYEVFAISRSKEPNEVYRPQNFSACLNYHFFQLDINIQLEEILEIIEREKLQYIINFIALGIPAESWKNPELYFQTNTLSQVRLHDKLRTCSFLQKYIHFSSSSVYGSTEGKIVENQFYCPSTPYATSKAATDMSLMSFYNAYNFPVNIIRLANVYGTYQQATNLIPLTVIRFLNNQKLDLHGGGISLRSFVYVSDVVNAIFKIILDAQIGEMFHVATQQYISIHDIVYMIAEQLNVTFDECVNVAPECLVKDTAYFLDTTKIRTELSWKERVTIEEGLSRTIDWIKSYKSYFL